MNILSRYYQGILNQINSEVHLINELIAHNGLKGEGNENVLINLLKKLIPKKYGIGSGIIVDKDGNFSKQCDIVIYDNYNYPEILSLTSVSLFPVDLVYAVIEVKTSIDSEKAKIAMDNIYSVTKLNYIKSSFNEHDPTTIGASGEPVFFELKTIPPIGVIFSYNSTTSNFITFRDWFRNSEEYNLGPRHIFCLDQGFLMLDPNNNYIPLVPPVIENNQYYVSDDGKKVRFLDKDWCERNGVLYPFTKVLNRELLVDQAKLLLNFIIILTNTLNAKRLAKQIDFRNDYFSDELFMLFTISNDNIVKYGRSK